LSDLTTQKTVTIQRTVLFGDCDPEGIVYTPRFSYFSVEAIQDALSIWLADKPKDPTQKARKNGGLRKLMDHGILPPARAFSLEFLHPVTWDDELSIKVWVCQITERSFSFQVEAWLETSRLSDAENILAFTAKLTQVCISRESHQSIPLPDDLRARLSELLL
jgi:acyl-CoA thioesterase FadM